MSSNKPPEYGQALTPREAEILRLVADGNINTAIATKLWITTDTVKTHLRRICRKLGATGGRGHAVHLAHQAGLLDHPGLCCRHHRQAWAALEHRRGIRQKLGPYDPYVLLYDRMVELLGAPQ